MTPRHGTTPCTSSRRRATTAARRRGCSLAAAAFTLVASARVVAQVATPTDTAARAPTRGRTLATSPLRLVRCYAHADVACFRVRGNLVDPSTTGDRMTATLDTAELIGPGVARAAIRDDMTPRRMLVYGVPISMRGGLGRRSRQFSLAALDDSPRRWRPPLVALPPFEGVADSTSVPREMVALSGALGSALRQRMLIGVPLFLLTLLAYLAVPRLVGGRHPSRRA